MEGPSAAYDEKKEGWVEDVPSRDGVFEEIVKGAENEEVNQGPKRNKVGGKRDQDVGLVGDHVAAIETYRKAGDSTEGEINEEDVSELMTQNVKIEPNSAENAAEKPSGANAASDGEIEELSGLPELVDEGHLTSLLRLGGLLKEGDGGDRAGDEEKQADDEANDARGQGEAVVLGLVEVDRADFGEGDIERGLDGAQTFAPGNAAIGAGARHLVGGAKGLAEAGTLLQRGLASPLAPFARGFEVDPFFGGLGGSPACHGR